jgi:hypothetical protein
MKKGVVRHFGEERFLLDNMPSRDAKKYNFVGALPGNFTMLVSVRY